MKVLIKIIKLMINVKTKQFYSVCCYAGKLWGTPICCKCNKPSEFLTEINTHEVCNDN